MRQLRIEERSKGDIESNWPKPALIISALATPTKAREPTEQEKERNVTTVSGQWVSY